MTLGESAKEGTHPDSDDNPDIRRQQYDAGNEVFGFGEKDRKGLWERIEKAKKDALAGQPHPIRCCRTLSWLYYRGPWYEGLTKLKGLEQSRGKERRGSQRLQTASIGEEDVVVRDSESENDVLCGDERGEDELLVENASPQKPAVADALVKPAQKTVATSPTGTTEAQPVPLTSPVSSLTLDFTDSCLFQGEDSPQLITDTEVARAAAHTTSAASVSPTAKENEESVKTVLSPPQIANNVKDDMGTAVPDNVIVISDDDDVIEIAPTPPRGSQPKRTVSLFWEGAEPIVGRKSPPKSSSADSRSPTQRKAGLSSAPASTVTKRKRDRLLDDSEEESFSADDEVEPESKRRRTAANDVKQGRRVSSSQPISAAPCLGEAAPVTILASSTLVDDYANAPIILPDRTPPTAKERSAHADDRGTSEDDNVVIPQSQVAADIEEPPKVVDRAIPHPPNQMDMEVENPKDELDSTTPQQQSTQPLPATTKTATAPHTSSRKKSPANLQTSTTSKKGISPTERYRQKQQQARSQQKPKKKKDIFDFPGSDEDTQEQIREILGFDDEAEDERGGVAAGDDVSPEDYAPTPRRAIRTFKTFKRSTRQSPSSSSMGKSKKRSPSSIFNFADEGGGDEQRQLNDNNGGDKSALQTSTSRNHIHNQQQQQDVTNPNTITPSTTTSAADSISSKSSSAAASSSSSKSTPKKSSPAMGLNFLIGDSPVKDFSAIANGSPQKDIDMSSFVNGISPSRPSSFDIDETLGQINQFLVDDLDPFQDLKDTAIASNRGDKSGKGAEREEEELGMTPMSPASSLSLTDVDEDEEE
ncbi:hypothetical protein HK102_006617 [Quaeritorhiza haematococci]|nr:hypothetical protein HK102_006617 [Quaeritorhiza haematococci]